MPPAAVNAAKCSCATSSLRWPFTKSTHGTPASRAKRCTAPVNPSVILASGAVEGTGNPFVPTAIALTALSGKRSQVLMRHVVLALTPDEIHPRHRVLAGEAVHRPGERLGDPRQRSGRGDRQPQLPVHIGHAIYYQQPYSWLMTAAAFDHAHVPRRRKALAYRRISDDRTGRELGVLRQARI